MIDEILCEAGWCIDLLPGKATEFIWYEDPHDTPGPYALCNRCYLNIKQGSTSRDLTREDYEVIKVMMF